MSKKKTATIIATGKRKTSIARATLKPGKGVIRINSMLLDVYQPEFAKMKIFEPLILSEGEYKNVDIKVNVRGGGFLSQAEATRVAISKALVEWKKELKQKFLDHDRTLLVSDIRRTEPQKPYRSAARGKRQKSKR